ncbi:efflux RND transporter periplasmic adaptor subunit [Extensimonas perlucida]|uniref:efflux RND transporter periplasmic adaptor subunit n=1 Tax=Extensimonas perlucida TaxID=2590786 RepID=UPI0011A0C333|nr:efflux RND transporter periplasmic adaptor subunit [Extensimonas perlucida]
MRFPRLQRRTLALAASMAPLALLFIYVALRSGPLAPVAVTVTTVQQRTIAPALAGIGTVQARYTYKIGPTYAGRIKRLDVHVGDAVKTGQVLGEMDPVDLDERIGAQQAAIKSAQAALRQAEAKQTFAQTQARRYEQLWALRGTSEESTAIKRQELAVADAALAAAREDASRTRAELQALRAQRSNLRLMAPAAGLVTARHADPGTTVVAGQAVVELIDTASLWVDTRFDQVNAEGLAAGLPARIVLRSRRGQTQPGRVLRIEPQADVVTEETLAKIVFDSPLSPLPPVGELAEVTVQLSELPAAATIPNAAIRTLDGKRGVWKLSDGKLAFMPIAFGRSDLDGLVQVEKGLAAGDQLVVYSEKALTARSRIHVVDRLPGVAP